MRILQIGNFVPPHSTENHLARALLNNGHEVEFMQETDRGMWENLAYGIYLGGYDFVLWTRTGWDWPAYGWSHEHAREMQLRFLLLARKHNIPVVGYHLDIWWGLKRQTQVLEEPFFRVPLLVTADGGHDAEWLDADIEHVWMPPGVSREECEPGMFRSDMAHLVVFVGNWRGEYHHESEHRFQLVQWLQENYSGACAFYPQPGQPGLRGAELRDLYTSCQVAVGDSCFAGTGLSNYWSDRIPETMGRGAYLLHPAVVGMGEQGFVNGETLGTWSAGQWGQLARAIEWALDSPDQRAEIAAAGRRLVLEKHTYEVRMTQLVELLYKRKMLKRPTKAKAAK